MRILDLDMDFFLNEIATNKPFDGIRLSSEEYIPWKKEDVEHFLENNCGLNKKRKVKGQIFDEHMEVFAFLYNRIQLQQLNKPFEIVHIDAHADLGLGFGDTSWLYIFNEFLSKTISERENIIKYNSNLKLTNRLNSGNYLLYIIACEWLCKLTYITHTKSKGDDYNI